MSDLATLSAYSTTDPAVGAVMAQIDAQWATFNSTVKAFADRWGRSAMITRSGGRVHLVGLNGWPAPGPEWRNDRGTWKPYRNKPAGKALHVEMIAAGVEFPPIPGCPYSALVQFSHVSPGVECIDGTWWATWTKGYEATEPLMDLSIWQRRKLSDYYLAVEAAA